jgi:hypothetical protein
MNVANLQLEGLLMAVAELNRLLVARGVVSTEDIGHALAEAERSAREHQPDSAFVSAANRDAILFPIRLLILANEAQRDGAMPDFKTLASRVGRKKEGTRAQER